MWYLSHEIFFENMLHYSLYFKKFYFHIKITAVHMVEGSGVWS